MKLYDKLKRKLSSLKDLSQFKRNTLSGSIVHGLNILVVMISYPVYINFLGFELFSVWALLSVVISFAMMGELGIGKAIITFTAKARAEENLEQVGKIMSAAFIIVFLTSAFLLLLLYLFNEPLAHLLSLPKQYLHIATQIIPLIGVAIITYLIFDVLSAMITGLGRLDITNLLLLSLNIAKVGFTILFLSLNYSLYSMVYGIFLANLVFIILASSILIVKFKFPLHGLSFNVRKNIFELINYGSSILGTQLLTMLTFPIIKIVLSKSLGIETVGIFELASKVGYAIRTLFEKGLFALMPEIAGISGNAAETKRKEIIYAKVKKITRLLVIYALPFFLLLAALSPIWLKLWLGANYNIHIFYGYLLLQPGIIFGLIALPSYFSLLGTRNQRFCLYEAVIRTILMLMLLAIFYFLNLQLGYIFLLISFSVILSNSYIILSFKRLFSVT